MQQFTLMECVMARVGLALVAWAALIIAAVWSGAAASAIKHISGPADSVSFGGRVAVLPNGNIVVTDPKHPDGGAAYLYDPEFNLLSRVTGVVSEPWVPEIDHVEIFVLKNGNYLLANPRWGLGRGMVAWGSATEGISGRISETTALVGARAGDEIGYSFLTSSSILLLENGNYVVGSPRWANHESGEPRRDAGAVTWGDGTRGVVGIVSSANSLVGKQQSDGAGLSLHALANGNYVSLHPIWKNDQGISVGSATWGNGKVGSTGVLTAENSLTGSQEGDFTFVKLTPLSNGNYVVVAPYWNDGAGAVTWCDGRLACVGPVSVANSLHGVLPGNYVGYSGVVALANGNYVVGSSDWEGPGQRNVGAITWGDGLGGVVGPVSTGNSLVGSADFQFIGDDPLFRNDGIVPLTNGNYVVVSPRWGEGELAELGAVTWGDGTRPFVGRVSRSNSLVGFRKGERVGLGSWGRSVVPLTNGNYVVISAEWKNPEGTQFGAVTWRRGDGPSAGVVSAENSLVGSNLGSVSVTALANGHYMTAFDAWKRGSQENVGALMWGDGARGRVGVVTETEALVGVSANGFFGNGMALPNGDYLACAPGVSYEGVETVGAATRVRGDGPLAGEISASNSLFGSQIRDSVCRGWLTVYDDGAYVIHSPEWSNGDIYQAGAITFGSGRFVGRVSAANSVVGDFRGEGAGEGRYGGLGMHPAYDASRGRLIVGRGYANKITIVTLDPPGAPRMGTASAGLYSGEATVTFDAPTIDGGGAITHYTATSFPGGHAGTCVRSPCIVSGLSAGTSYIFTITATNRAGTGAASVASNSVTPSATAAPPLLRPDRVIVRENSGIVEINVLANDSIPQALINDGTLSIATAPTRGTASVLNRGTANALDDVIRYVPAANTAGEDALVYRMCFGGVAPCVDGRLSIEVRPIALTGLELDASADRGFREQTLAGLRALPAARFDAHGLVVPVITDAMLNDASDASAPWGAGRTVTLVRTLAAGAAARDWRVLVDARGTSGGDVDLFLGVDSNGNGVADASELVCSSAMSMSERCDLALTAPANGSARYWALAYSSLVGQSARLEVFETPLDVPAANRTLVATAPGALAGGESFPVRLAWNDATFLPGQSRGGWLNVRADEGTSLGWVPVRIDRAAGEAGAFALESGVGHVLALQAGAAHERLYIDVPPGATQLAVTTTSASNVDLYLARVDAPAASGVTPTIAAAPVRNLAIASAVTGSGNESLSISNPASGRWYVTPVNPSAGATTFTVRATVIAVAPQIRPGGYFNPLRSGNGLFLYPAGSELAGLWYTYLQDGTPTWYYLQAAAPGDNGIWRGIIYRSAWNGSSNRLTAVGHATVTPATAGAFTFNYTVDGETGSEAYSNFSGACPTVSGTPLDISGHWFDPLRSGSGYSVQSFPDYEFYLVFGYDARGVPRYLVAERSGFGGPNETLALEQLRGVCPLCTRTANPSRTAVGTLQRHIEGGTLRNITLSATYVNGVPGTWAANDAVTPLGSLRGCSP
ncbi:MAG: Ig-like domain-containing protein [Rhizobiaceae bacterium]|nr:Ig-like domain-containing protein [Rhizobiaceae bacterium]